MSRRAGNWLDGFMYYTGESESPNSYLRWVGISTLAGATQRKVGVEWIYYRYYPNMYIVLVGPPGIVHKSSVIRFAKHFLHEAGIPIGSEAITKEALIEQMQLRETEGNCALTLTLSELSTFIAPSGPAMVEFLTDIYDSPDKWTYTTRKHGDQDLPNSFLNLLAGTTPGWISQSFDSTFVEQGLASRTLFIFEDRPRFRRAFAQVSDEQLRMREALIEDLIHISGLQGSFYWTPAGRDWFSQWYDNELEDEKLDYRLQGYLARKPTHVIKLAMVLALAQHDELLLDHWNLTEAKRYLDAIEPAMVRTFSTVGKNPFATDLERIWADIKTEGRIEEQDFRRRNRGALRKADLDDQIKELLSMGAIRLEVTNGQRWLVSNE